MITLETEDIGRSLARGRQLPAATIGELERRAGVGACPCHIPLIGSSNLFRESQRYGPTTQRSSAGIGHAHVYLKECTAGIGRRRCAAVRTECLATKQQAGQQQSILNQYFHCQPLSLPINFK